jgi:hypothetical protein
MGTGELGRESIGALDRGVVLGSLLFQQRFLKSAHAPFHWSVPSPQGPG